MSVAIAQQSFNRDSHCGDRAACWTHGDRVVLCMIDGLGHGKKAEDAALAAEVYIAEHLSDELEDIFFGCNVAVQGTIGVGMGVAIIDRVVGMLSFAGIGNTAAKVISRYNPQPFGLGSDPGVIGESFPSLFTESILFAPGDMIVMYTDGIASRINLNRYKPEDMRDIDRWAVRLLDDWGLETDDRTVLVFVND